MKDYNITDYFMKSCERIGVSINENEISKFFDYKDLLISWNEKINLTAITDNRDIILKHFVDSLSLLEFVEYGAKIIDVGTGAGFPGLPLKIMKEEIKLTLLDSLMKRILFLDEVVHSLELGDVETIHERAENAGKSTHYREQFDIAVSRAVAPMAELAEYCLPFVKPGGYFLAMKGGNMEKEISDSLGAINVLGGEISGVKNFSLSEGSDFRTIVKISKIKKTPEGYPRKAGIPSKSPILAK